jgi:mRNA-degrading endonuclease RelE of RelBE toxin-antitoxin system
VVVSFDVEDLLDPDSMSKKPASVVLFEDRASHAGQSFDTAMSLCRIVVLRLPEAHYVAYYADGVYGFAADTLADTTPHLDQPADSMESRRSDYERVGCQFSNAVKDLDGTLQVVRTGTLIRALLHGSRGVICCNFVVPNEYVVGLTFDASALPAADAPLSELPGGKKLDIAISRLSTVLRRKLSLESLNPGSWISPKPVGDGTRNVQKSDSATTQDLEPHIEGDADDLADLFRAEVHPDNLHYLAYCRDGEIIYSVDQLGHRKLSLFFIQITPEKRRKFYHDFCRQLPTLIGRLGRMVGSAIGGRLERVVLDVEQGAIYYYRLRPGEYLVGVTIDQGRVAQVDKMMALLALHCKSADR